MHTSLVGACTQWHNVIIVSSYVHIEDHIGLDHETPNLMIIIETLISHAHIDHPIHVCMNLTTMHCVKTNNNNNI